ncbi:tektin-1-like isoform X2 [Ctenocephalides felis]|uniref:tektin-1-like isoform X2 n=1 Tax=Ctenocephalides felis TaxID=7515 RepID=UPI000E6E28BE|nr:tektin-1-like isoform X2 [Ctenocephalides felis]
MYKFLEAIPPPPAKYTLDDWYFDVRQKYRRTEDQQQLADRVLSESDRIRDETTESSERNKKEVDHRISEKIKDIEFFKKEVERERKECMIEIEALTTYRNRLIQALNALSETALKQCRKCIILREGRLGIDLCQDDVERELRKEIEVIQGAQCLLQRTMEEANEQIRRLRSTVYFLDRDHEDKTAALRIDQYNKSLNNNSMALSIYEGTQPLNPATITYEEYVDYTCKNIDRGAKEINSGRIMRSYVDTLLKQVTTDLMEQYNRVNEAFRIRISEIRESKTKMEVKHAETQRQANEMTLNITGLEKALYEKESFLALAHTRLGNRAQRPGIEFCKDPVDAKLMYEVRQLKENTHKLQNMLLESQASLRYLLRAQIQLEEDINIKTNSLKIDEVDCLGLRESMDYHSY